jgi:hypothetical protein
MLTTHPHLGSRSRMRSYIPLLPSTSMACSRTALLYFRWILRKYSRKLLLPFLQFAFSCYLQQFFRCAFNFHIFIMHCIVYLNFMFPEFQSSRDLHLYKALRGNSSDIKWCPLIELLPFTSLECLKREQIQHKMASAEGLLVFACFVTYYYHNLLVSHPTKTNTYTALQNENGLSCLTIIVNKRQLTMPYGGRNHKWHSLQATVLKNCDE